MIKTDKYNNVPDKIKKRIPKMSGVIQYKTIKGVWNKDKGMMIPPSMAFVRGWDRVITDDGEVIQIAHVVRQDATGAPQINHPCFEIGNAGRIIIRPIDGTNDRYSVADILLYEYLELTNFNGSNPYRDQSEPIEFVKVDDNASAGEALKETIQVNEVVAQVLSLKDDDILLICRYIGMEGIEDIKDQPDTLRVKLLQFAQSEPQRYIDAAHILDEIGKYVKVINEAVEKKVIKLDKRDFKFKWTPSNVAFYTGNKSLTEGDNIAALARWLKNTQEGAGINTQMEKAIV